MTNGRSLREAITARAAQIALGVSPDGLHRFIRDGYIAPAGRIDECLIFWLSEVEKLAAKTAEQFMPVIEAAHTVNMQPTAFVELMQASGVPSRFDRGSRYYSDIEVRRFAAKHDLPYRTEPEGDSERIKYRQQSRMVAARARRTGRLVPLPCELCGAKKVHGHHEDYTRPLEVRWLCQPCHSSLHPKVKKLKIARRTMPRLRAPKHASWMTHSQRRERRDAIVQLAKNGESIDALAAKFHLCPTTIYQYVRKHA